MRLAFLPLVLACAVSVQAQRQMEYLDRGLVAVRTAADRVFLSWRLLADDPADIAFDVFRLDAQGDRVKLNPQPLREATCFVDEDAPSSSSVRYLVRPRGDAKPPADHAVQPWTDGYLTIPLQTPSGYRPNDAAVGDLDGDGRYEIVLHQAGRGHDNAHAGLTDPPVLEAYTLDGSMLWRINLGRNIREGAHYVPFIVYDLDGDGRAEIACRTADGTIDGAGRIIGDAQADHRDARGYILTGPEFLTVFDGATGRALATTDYLPPRGRVEDWGDSTGNRADRFLACVAYLDGERPSLVMCRGYYTRSVLAAWDWRDGRLRHRWTFDSDDGRADHRDYHGQGNHGLSVADVDGDGRDEIVYGACVIDHDGSGLYTTGLDHGDAMHLSDIDPTRPGLEVWGIHERPRHAHGANLRDAETGRVLWGLPLDDPGRGMAADIDPRYPGYECWANSSDGLYDCKGNRISRAKPRSCNMAVWWDGDLSRELLSGTAITKWDALVWRESVMLYAEGCAANNGSKANPCLAADILGDWREEVLWRTSDNRALRLYTSTIPTEHRLTTLAHDPVYRLSVAWQNVGYNQPTQPGFYLGTGMSRPDPPAIRVPAPRGSAP